MIAPGVIIVGLRSTREVSTTWRAGEEFARIFGATLRARVFEEPGLSDVCDLPGCFLPRALAGRPQAGMRQTMIAAMAREIEGIRRQLRTRSRETRIEVEVSVERHETGGDGAGSVVVLPIDLSDRPLGRQIAAAGNLVPEAGGVLLVPRERPSRSGDVVCLAGDGADRMVGLASRIASGLGVSMVLAAGEGATPVSPDQQGPVPPILRLAPGQRLGAGDLSAAGARLIICDRQSLDLLEVDGPQSILLKSRAPLLVLSGQQPAGPGQEL